MKLKGDEAEDRKNRQKIAEGANQLGDPKTSDRAVRQHVPKAHRVCSHVGSFPRPDGFCPSYHRSRNESPCSAHNALPCPFGGSMKLTFWGAAGTVTGSMPLLETGGRPYLLDCGLYQGRRKDADRKNRVLPFPGSSIDAVVLSHAHIDHSGNLPSLVKSGFSGPVYATPATIDLCAWMLRDTAHIQEKDAEFVNKRLEKGKT